MDGVVADFQRGVYQAFNQPYDYARLPRAYNFWSAWDKPTPTRSEVDAKCNNSFWANLPWTHDGKQILEAVLKVFSFDQIYLLTVPMPNVLSATGKMRWVAKNIPELYSRTLIGPVPKELLAKPDRLLIDDHDKYVDAFRAEGGKTIRVPRPWNCLYPWCDISLQFVQLSLRHFTAERKTDE
jgi:5'(3')-deoxyribonucleotidase